MAKKLLSDFTFGFEFEGFANLNYFMTDISDYDYDYDYWGELPCNGLNEDDYDCFYSSVNEFINDHLGCKKGRTHYDGSVKNYNNGYQSFEYSSTVYKFNAKNMFKLKRFFNNMDRYGFGINETCGFHTHISFPKISERDAIWIICQIANNNDSINEFCYMKTKDDIIRFYSDRYANKDFLYIIQNKLMQNDFTSLVDVINGDKYRVIRIHPQGTLEWRGPRNFLNINGGIELFIEKLYKIVNILSNAMSATSLNGMSKDEFFEKLSTVKSECYFDGRTFPSNSKFIKRKGKVGLTDGFGKSDFGYSIRDVTSRICQNIIKNPKKLFSQNNNLFFNDIINHLKRFNHLDSIMESLGNDLHKIPNEDKMKLVNSCPKYLNILSADSIKNLSDNTIFRWIESTDKNSTSSVEYVLSNINKNILIDCSVSLLSNYVSYIDVIIKLIEKGVYKDMDITPIFQNYCRSDKLFFQYTNHNTRITSKELHTILKEYMKKGLILDVTDKNSFGNEYFEDSTDEVNHFYVIDSINTLREMINNHSLDNVMYFVQDNSNYVINDDISQE